MKKIISIISAKHTKKLILIITFDDGHSSKVDFSDFLNQTNLPDLIRYKKISNFKKYKILNGNIIWGDYEMIFPLESLYFNRLTHRSKKIKKAS